MVNACSNACAWQRTHVDMTTWPCRWPSAGEIIERGNEERGKLGSVGRAGLVAKALNRQAPRLLSCSASKSNNTCVGNPLWHSPLALNTHMYRKHHQNRPPQSPVKQPQKQQKRQKRRRNADETPTKHREESEGSKGRGGPARGGGGARGREGTRESAQGRLPSHNPQSPTRTCEF